MRGHWIFLLIALLVITELVFAATMSSVDGAAPRVIEVIADKDNTFKVIGSKKPIIIAHPNEVLKLKITAYKAQEADSDGAVHSLTIKDFADQGWDIRLYEGTRTYTLVVPEEAGEYVFECVVKCGEGHDDMRGKLIVKRKKEKNSK